MAVKHTIEGDWIRDYLQSMGIDTSDWREYQTLYLRYRARIRKYKPTTYQEFLQTCTFRKQRKIGVGAEDLGDYSVELGGWGKKKVKKPKGSPRVLKELEIKTPEDPPFPMEKWIREQKKDWENYKARMKRYREDKIRNLTQQGETGRLRDYMPFLFKFALKCLSGTYPEECFPESLEEYKEELQDLLNSEQIFFSLNIKKEK